MGCVSYWDTVREKERDTHATAILRTQERERDRVADRQSKTDRQWNESNHGIFGSKLINVDRIFGNWTKCSFFGGVSRKFKKCDFSNASERLFPGVLGDFSSCFAPSKKVCLSTHELTRSSSTGVVTTPRHTLWNRVFCEFVQCGVDTPHIHTSEGDSSFCLFVLQCHNHADGRLGFCQQKRLSQREKSVSLERFRFKSNKFR